MDSLVRQVDRRGSLLILAGALAFFVAGRGDVSLGLLVGGIASLLNFHLLAHNARKMRLMTPKQASRAAFSNVGLRYPVMALALAIPLLFPESFSFAACATGLFVGQIVLVFSRFSRS